MLTARRCAGYTTMVSAQNSRSYRFVSIRKASSANRCRTRPASFFWRACTGHQMRMGRAGLMKPSCLQFAPAVVSILQEADLAQQLAAAGRANVEQHYDWQHIYPAWDPIYAS